MSNLPHFQNNGKHTLLYVDGKPFTMLSGEIHNSSSSSAEYMDKIVWPSLRNLNMNSIIMPIFWENIEPKEDCFDFSLVDTLIVQARREKVKIVFLWFGLWKNGMSTYVPGWVKTNASRYFRVQGTFGNIINTISPLCQEAVSADAKAFGVLMAHLKDFDGETNTVLMVQVENEIGILGSPRDFSPVAEDAFSGNVPDSIASYFNVSGSWETAFGGDACEYFMAYHYSCAIEKIAQTGKKAYNIPLMVNAWLEQFPSIPGAYPSGGPVAKVADIWRLNAPTIECYAPDIYVENFRDVCNEYTSIPQNPLCIPETRGTLDSVPFLLYALGKHNAICFAPFAIEDLFLASVEEVSSEVLNVLKISANAFGKDPKIGQSLAHAYKIIGGMQDVIQDAHQNGKIHAFLQFHDNGAVFNTKDTIIKVSYNGAGSFFMPQVKREGTPVAGGFIIEIGENDYIIAGVECTVEFLPKVGCKKAIASLIKEEGSFINGKWSPGRVLNGDEGYFHSCGSILNLIRVKVFSY